MSASSLPTKCCGQEIPKSRYHNVLPEKTVRLYEEKLAEFGVPNPVYCHRRECSAFIPQYERHAKDEVALCTKCKARTCKKCKQAAHVGECPPDEELEKVVALARNQHWRRCAQCGTMIEKDEGCQEMRWVRLLTGALLGLIAMCLGVGVVVFSASGAAGNRDAAHVGIPYHMNCRS